jgi:DNA-binding cell septation regulator SpoVG
MKIVIEVLEIRLIADKRYVKAFADIRAGDFIITDFRIMQNLLDKHLYVRAPSVAYKDDAGQLKFKPILKVPDDQLWSEIVHAILTAYHQREKEQGNEPTQIPPTE